jgi:hypothetical protein
VLLLFGGTLCSVHRICQKPRRNFKSPLQILLFALLLFGGTLRIRPTKKTATTFKSPLQLLLFALLPFDGMLLIQPAKATTKF